MRRLLAVLAAAAMIAIAVVARGAIDDGDDADGGGGDGGDGLVVVCARDLREACEALDGVTVIYEDAAATAAAITAGDLGGDVDAWLTTSAWTEVVTDRVQGRLGDPVALARTPAALAVAQPRSSAVLALCEPITWACLGEHAGAPWGSIGGEQLWGAFKVGLPSADSATGLAVLASVAVGTFGGAEFAANDFAGDFEGRLDRLLEASGAGDRDPVATLVTRPGTYTAAGGLRADTEPVRDRAYTFVPEQTVFATAVLVPVAGRDGVPGVGGARDALQEAGWDAAAEDSSVARTLKPGVMAALHSLWTEITR